MQHAGNKWGKGVAAWPGASAGLCCRVQVCAPLYSSCSADPVNVARHFTGHRDVVVQGGNGFTDERAQSLI